MSSGVRRTTPLPNPESQLRWGIVDTESNDRKLDDLRNIVEKVERKALVRPDDPDMVALRHIVENRISELKQAPNHHQTLSSQENVLQRSNRDAAFFRHTAQDSRAHTD